MTDDPRDRDKGQPDEHGVEAGAEPEPESDVAITPEEARLFALASRIDQGHPVDWDAAERDARDDRERAIIAEMRLLADVARVGREQADISDATLSETGRASGEAITEAHTDAAADAATGRAPRQTDWQAAWLTGWQTGGQSASYGDTQTGDSTPRRRVPDVPPATWGSLSIQEPIGHGAFSTVYRAQDNLGRLVALKLFPLRERGIDWAARLLHEGRLLARLRHENVVSVYGADQGDGYVGLWMELVRGRTLEDELHTRVRFSAEEAAHVGRVLCRALAAVHRAGLLHRDVKAHNVMRDEAGRIVLMDFGSGRDAQIADVESGMDVAGTPLYLAPEVFRGQPASISSDIYSLAVLLFHLVSDRYPVEGTDRREIQRAHAERRRVWLRDVRPDLSDAFVRVVERALATDRTQRYQSAGELEDALAQIDLPSVSEHASQPAPQPASQSASQLASQDAASVDAKTADSSASSSSTPSSGSSATTGGSTTSGGDSGPAGNFDAASPKRGAWHALASGSGATGSSARVVPSSSTPTAPAGDPPLKSTPRQRWQMLAVGASLTVALATLLGVVSMALRSGTPLTPTLTSTQMPGESASPAAPTASGSKSASGSASPTPLGAPARSDAASYTVHASFYKEADDGRETPLAFGDRVAPGDKLGLRLTTSKPAYVYVANQDEQGDAFLLYPLHREVGSPLAAQREHRLPVDDNGDLWQVTSAGGREHFLVFVNQTPMDDFDRLLRELRPADAGRALTSLPIPGSVLHQVRGVGGLAKPKSAPSRGLQHLFERAKPLSVQQETVEGEWIRELMLVNPTRGRPTSSR